MKDYITNLAPEGTTVLFLRQTKTGACVPYLPEKARFKPKESWFGNIGLYLPDRFTDGPRAQSRMIEQVWAMMLDDIGTKSATPPLEPTWKVESSPGNYQWVYVFRVDAMPNKAQFNAALKAIADAGFTDPGANNPVRNFRIPGSWNARKQFEARLVELHEDREFALDEICQAFGVTPGEASGEAVHLDIKDDGTGDTIFQWAQAQGLLLDGVNAAGWCSIVCPNHGEHSNDDVGGRYFPASRAYKCMHGHCVDWDSQRFLAWVASQGGPEEDYGLRDELLAERVSGALAKLTPTEAYPDEAARVVEEVERKELGRLTRADWPKRFVYVESEDAFFDIKRRVVVRRRTFDALFRHVDCRSIHNSRLVTASVAFDETREASGSRVATGQTYAPGAQELILIEDDWYVNKWRDRRLTGREGDASPWLQWVERVIPIAVEREHFFNMVAFKFQNPGVKINHGMLLFGVQGLGKDTMIMVIGMVLGSIATMDDQQLMSKWGYDYESELLVLNEMRLSEARDRRAVENILKPLLAAPPLMLTVEKKNQHPYKVMNQALVMAFSNHAVPIALPGDDRRWFVVKSPAGPADGRELVDWYKAGGADIVAGWLKARDVSAFNPGAPAPMTDAKASLIESGMSSVEARLVAMIRAREGVFALGVVGGPWQDVCDAVTAPGQSQVYVTTLLLALQEAGWVDKGRVMSRHWTTKRAIYCAPDMADRPKSELRELIEKPARAGLSLISGKKE